MMQQSTDDQKKETTAIQEKAEKKATKAVIMMVLGMILTTIFTVISVKIFLQGLPTKESIIVYVIAPFVIILRVLGMIFWAACNCLIIIGGISSGRKAKELGYDGSVIRVIDRVNCVALILNSIIAVYHVSMILRF